MRKIIFAALMLGSFAVPALAQDLTSQRQLQQSSYSLSNDQFTLFRYGIPTGATISAIFTQNCFAKTTNYTLKTTDSGKCFANSGAGGTVTFTLPTGDGRMRFDIFAFQDGRNVTITAQPGGSIGYGGAASTNLNSISIPDNYGFVRIKSITSTQWIVESITSNFDIARMAQSVPSDTVTLTAQAYTMVGTDLNSVMLVTSGASDATITLMSAATAGDGKLAIVRKADSGAGKVIVTDGSTDRAWLSAQNDIVALRSNGSAWQSYWWEIAPRADVFTSGGTYTAPPLAKYYDVTLIGGGSGGGSGMQGAASTARGGGGGGSSGAICQRRILPSEMGGSQSVSIAATAAGGAAQASTDSNGVTGTAGNPTLLGGLMSCRGSAAGTGGTTAAGIGGTGIAALGTMAGAPASGGSSSLTATGVAGTAGNTGPGSGGGSIDSSDNIRAGGTGATGSTSSFTRPTAGTGGAACTNGGAGADIASSVDQLGGSGGGGGGGCASGVGGTGGAGGAPGGGGGGGGAALNGAASGAGGAGARGEARITATF